MKKCKNCGENLEDNVKFCPECGTKQDIKKFCTECGAELSPTAKFCMECGTPVNTSKIETPKTQEKATVKVEMHNEDEDDIEDSFEEEEDDVDEKIKDIVEQGGIIVYEDEDHGEMLEEGLSHFISGYDEEREKHRELTDHVMELIQEDGWYYFGEAAKDVKKYGDPGDDYDGKSILYRIINNDTLILVGEGNTFRILSEKDQKSAKNYWVLNSDIRKMQDKITTLVVVGKEMSIRARLFKDFKNLETVILSDSVTGIRLEAFYNCPIKFINIPTELDQIVEYSFKNAKFEFLFFPPMLTDAEDITIQDDAFVDCKQLKYVFIPRSLVDEIDIEDCFKGCDRLDTDNIWYLDDYDD